MPQSIVKITQQCKIAMLWTLQDTDKARNGHHLVSNNVGLGDIGGSLNTRDDNACGLLEVHSQALAGQVGVQHLVVSQAGRLHSTTQCCPLVLVRRIHLMTHCVPSTLTYLAFVRLFCLEKCIKL